MNQFVEKIIVYAGIIISGCVFWYYTIEYFLRAFECQI